MERDQNRRPEATDTRTMKEEIERDVQLKRHGIKGSQMSEKRWREQNEVKAS